MHCVDVLLGRKQFYSLSLDGRGLGEGDGGKEAPSPDTSHEGRGGLGFTRYAIRTTGYEVFNVSEIKIVNATGLACPQPVVLAKEAIEKNEKVKVIVDNETALENVTRMGTKLGCNVATEAKAGGLFEITLTRKTDTTIRDIPVTCGASSSATGPFVIVCTEDKMGRGNDELGSVLIRAFLHTISQQKEKPDVMIFYNTGVKLAIQGSEVLNDLKELAVAGVEILVCGTCLNYFEVKDKLDVGVVSNMYDIAAILSKAGRLLYP